MEPELAVRAVLIDRDGTLVVNVPYNGDPRRVQPMSGAKEALDRLRARGLRLAVVTNQSGVGRGLLRAQDVEAVNRRVEEMLGPFDGWFVCPHAPEDGCDCRKPAPGLLLQATRALGVRPKECVMIGDIADDAQAARRAGMSSIVVPPVRSSRGVAGSPDFIARDLAEAADLILSGRAGVEKS